MTFDFSELLTHLEDGERSLSTVPATIWTGRIPHDVGSDIDDLNLARCIAADRDFPAPDSRAPMLVVLTDRRLRVGQVKRGLRSERGLRRVLGEVPLDRIVGIEPTKVSKDVRSAKSYNWLALVCVALVWISGQGADAVVWLPDFVLNIFMTPSPLSPPWRSLLGHFPSTWGSALSWTFISRAARASWRSCTRTGRLSLGIPVGLRWPSIRASVEFVMAIKARAGPHSPIGPFQGGALRATSR
jgi:hypothetical protein